MNEKKYFATFEVEIFACNDKEVVAAATALKKALEKAGANDPILTKIEQPVGGLDTRKVDVALLDEKESCMIDSCDNVEEAMDVIRDNEESCLKETILEYYTGKSAREDLLQRICEQYKVQKDTITPDSLKFEYTLDICSYKNCEFTCYVDFNEDMSECDIEVDVKHEESGVELEFYPGYYDGMQKFCDDIIRPNEVLEAIKAIM